MKKDAAVSPVIGAILMIVLTIIIAAVASSFAGGMVETKSKLPIVTLEAEYFIDGDLSLTHIAGDSIPLSQISLQLTPSQTFDADAARYSRAIDKTNVQDANGKNWGEIAVMQVGDRHRIANANLGVLDDGVVNTNYQVTVPASRGKTFYLEVYYDRSLIAKPEVLIR
jgi:FlaG/FlaF family flagellin (archaellin)